MGKRSRSKKGHLQAQYQQLQAKRRRGLIIMIGAIVLVVVLMILKTYFTSLGFEWATNSTVNIVFYVFILCMAGVAGYGGRSWSVTGSKMRELAEKLNR